MCRQIYQAKSPVAPGQSVAAIRMTPEGREEFQPTWGFPMTSPDGATKLVYNARAETAASKPTFKALMDSMRCLIPAESFTEFDANRQPQTFLPWDENETILLAGLWRPPSRMNPGDSTTRCVIFTQQADSLVKPHHHRMPPIITPEEAEEWLSPATTRERIVQLLRPREHASLAMAA